MRRRCNKIDRLSRQCVLEEFHDCSMNATPHAFKVKKDKCHHHYRLIYVCKKCGKVKEAPKPDPPVEKPEETVGWGWGI